MRSALSLALLVAGLTLATADLTNGGFEAGNFAGWVADPNWVVVDNSAGYYSGWAGKYWAWSGGKGEPALGKLTSLPFVLDKPAVHLLISGWGSIRGSGQPRHWNYVTLNLEDGTEIDRVWAPDGTSFVPAYLDGSKYRGRKVYIQAVDDADQPTFSMLCVDDVHTADLPPEMTRPAPALPPFDPAKSAKLEDDAYLVEVSRANGSITRLRDKTAGLDLILEPRLAGSFTFALPIPGKEPWQTIEANWIHGRDQLLSSCRLEGKRLTLRWDGPLRNYLADLRSAREKFAAGAVMTIELRDGGVLFSFRISNRSQYPVGEVYFPVLGGLQGLGKTWGQLKATQFLRPTGPTGRRRQPVAGQPSADPVTCTSSTIFQMFGNMAPFGDQGPEQFYAYPDSQPEPWIGFTAPKLGRSVCIGVHDPADRALVVRLMLSPSSSGTPRDDGNWPRPEELGGLPVGVELSFVDTAGGPAKTDYSAAPVFLQFLDGSGPEMLKAFSAWGEAQADKPR